jgi:Spy/CpxP family protein refolding chaperone
MFAKLTTIAAAAMLVSFTAFAQDNTDGGNPDSATSDNGTSTSGNTDPTGGSTKLDNGSNSTSSAEDNHQMEWDANVGETFYSDMKARTLRPEAEWSANWTKLTDDQRANIKKDCEAASQTNRDEAETQICTFASAN